MTDLKFPSNMDQGAVSQCADRIMQAWSLAEAEATLESFKETVRADERAKMLADVREWFGEAEYGEFTTWIEEKHDGP